MKDKLYCPGCGESQPFSAKKGVQKVSFKCIYCKAHWTIHENAPATKELEGEDAKPDERDLKDRIKKLEERFDTHGHNITKRYTPEVSSITTTSSPVERAEEAAIKPSIAIISQKLNEILKEL